MRDRINQKVEENSELLIESLRKVLKIDSTRGESSADAPFGKGPKEALKTQLEIAEALGFRTFNRDNYYGYAQWGDGDDYICALGHLDIVPVGTGWANDPFSGNISDGKLWGRGTVDDKGPINAALFGLYALKELSFEPKVPIRIIFGCDEETGCEDMAVYNKYEKPPICGFTPDADFPAIFAEKGILHFNLKTLLPEDSSILELKGGTVINAVAASADAKIRYTGDHSSKTTTNQEYINITTTGKNAHGSMPELGDNAICKLIDEILQLEFITPKERETLSQAYEFLCKSTDGAELGINTEDETGHLTMNLGLASLKDNTLTLSVDLRYPCTKKKDDILKSIKEKLTCFELCDIVHDYPLYQPKDSDLIRTLTGIYADYYKDNSPAVAIGGGTYAKHLKNIVAFGPCIPGEEYTEHTNHEFISIEHLKTITKIYANAFYELSR